MNKIKLFYLIKPLIPERFIISCRRLLVKRQYAKYSDLWPINEPSMDNPTKPESWPENKKFAVVLTHDVETDIGHDRCLQLMEIEKELGFKSSYNFVPERYTVSPKLRQLLVKNGFEVGVHGLNHDGKLYSSREEFERRAKRINMYLKEWNSVGFRSPAMHHNLEWLMSLDVLYDASTFDTDPFEPQPDGMNTIFPFIVYNGTGPKYVELPYTLAQDYTLFILLQEKTIDLWKKKIDWIAEQGGMVLVNVHPDYIYFNSGKKRIKEFSVELYKDLLRYINNKYENNYWQPLPREIAKYWREEYGHSSS